ncbi:MAG: hypothetical protein C4291_14300 [Candidatus Dadabacteria bacterium]
MKVSVIVPTYKEKDNLPELIDRIFKALKGYDFEVIIVDDNSPDGTAGVARGLSKIYGNIKVIERPVKLGLASAIRDGISNADGDVIVCKDADLQHPPELLPKMIEKAKEGYEVVIASRYIDGGKIEGWSAFRKFISKSAILLAHILFPKMRAVKDVASGFFLLKRGVISGTQLNSTGYKIIPEVLVKGKYERVTEIPYVFKPRKRGKSKLSLKDVISYAVFLLKLKLGK